MRFDLPAPLQSVDIDGYALNYYSLGDGAPVLLVHGSLCDCRYWHAQAPALAGRRGDRSAGAWRVLVPSLRHYWPDTTADDAEFSIVRHAADLALMLDRLRAGPAHVIGHSRGARVALELALMRPELVRRLVLADPPLRLADQAADPATAAPHLAQALSYVRAGDVDTGLGIFVDAVNGPGTWARMVRGFRDMARENAHTLAGQAGEPPAPVDEAALRELALPVLLVGGALGPARYAQAQDTLERLLPDVQRITIAGAAHGMNLARPHSFNAAVAAFLTGGVLA